MTTGARTWFGPSGKGLRQWLFGRELPGLHSRWRIFWNVLLWPFLYPTPGVIDVGVLSDRRRARVMRFLEKWVGD